MIEVMWYGNWCVIDQPKNRVKLTVLTFEVKCFEDVIANSQKSYVKDLKCVERYFDFVRKVVVNSIV